MNYTDKQLEILSRVAYLDLDEAEYKRRSGPKEKVSVPLLDLISDEDLAKLESNKDFKITREDLADYKVSGLSNCESGSGMYGFIAETDKNNAIVVFRGSEPLDNIKEDVKRLESNIKEDGKELGTSIIKGGGEAVIESIIPGGTILGAIKSAKESQAKPKKSPENYDSLGQLVKDWLLADLGLGLGIDTLQQRDAEKMLVKYKDKLSNYDNINVTGHSLGGNLAEHFAVMMGHYGLGDKLSRCTSIDGPGFSELYLFLHRKDIAKVAGKMDHRSGSIVGTLLKPLTGSPKTKFYLSKTDHPVNSHAIENNLHEGDSLLEGKESEWSKLVHDITEGAAYMGPGAYTIAGLLLAIGYGTIKYAWQKVDINTLIKEIQQFINRVGQWAAKTMSSIGIISVAGSELKLDTALLRQYAERTRSILNRANALESRINNLYWNSGLLGLYNLRNMYLLTGYNYRLNRCIAYLNDTASDFENVEADLNRKL